MADKNQGVGPWHVVEPDAYLINDVFRQIEEQINRLRGLGVPISIVVHTHQTTAQGGKLDHGAALTGLADNDHPQYLLASAVTTDQAVEQATSVDRISDQLMVGATLTLAEQADGSGDAIQLALADTAVTPGTYGDASNVAQVTVDQQGRLTSASNVAIVVTATEANDIGFIDATEGATRITDEIMVGEDLTLTEPGEMAGDSIFLDVATAQTLDDGQGDAAQGFETVVDGLGDFGIAIDSTGRPHLQGTNRFRHLNSMVRVTHSVNQSIPVSTVTKLNFDTEIYDTDTLHDTITNNSRLTAAIAGKYIIGLSFALAADATGTFRQSRILLNNTTVIGLQTLAPVGANDVFIFLVTVKDLAVSDYVEAQAVHDAAGALNVNTASEYTPIFSMAYIGE